MVKWLDDGRIGRHKLSDLQKALLCDNIIYARTIALCLLEGNRFICDKLMKWPYSQQCAIWAVSSEVV